MEPGFAIVSIGRTAEYYDAANKRRIGCLDSGGQIEDTDIATQLQTQLESSTSDRCTRENQVAVLCGAEIYREIFRFARIDWPNGKKDAEETTFVAEKAAIAKSAADKSATSNDSVTSNNGESSADPELLGFPPINQIDNHGEKEKDNDSDCSVYIACSPRPNGLSALNVTTKIECDQASTSTTPTLNTLASSIRYAAETQSNNERIDEFFRSMGNIVKTFPPRIIAEVKLSLSTQIGQIELQLAKIRDGEEVLFDFATNQ